MKQNFNKRTGVRAAIPAVLVVIALIMQLCGAGLNLDADLTGGVLLEVSRPARKSMLARFSPRWMPPAAAMRA